MGYITIEKHIHVFPSQQKKNILNKAPMFFALSKRKSAGGFSYQFLNRKSQVIILQLSLPFTFCFVCFRY